MYLMATVQKIIVNQGDKYFKTTNFLGLKHNFVYTEPEMY
jgi:hypothetical protein